MPENELQKRASAYRLAELDPDFLLGESMRGVRFFLEFAKAEERLRSWGIRSTVVVFGSARAPAAERHAAPSSAAEAAQRARVARWYEQAREFGRIVSQRGGAITPIDGMRDNVIATGGGPGIMEAANRGAFEVGAPSIGFNIQLPHEQEPNPYTTPDLTFQFHYFAMRKMHLAMRAAALVVFPGGFGTLDELFEILTLVQTGKAPKIPVVCFDKAYWMRLVNFDALLQDGMISAADLALITFVDDPEAAWTALVAAGIRTPEAGASGEAAT
ncbi:MAG TPA: TIGR00730 family Rossman fold protein [Xanthobacteraceae bacterium]|nr:TIGR00730 family Rossman fold protein [Xanthobacteraceae bacterium]